MAVQFQVSYRPVLNQDTAQNSLFLKNLDTIPAKRWKINNVQLAAARATHDYATTRDYQHRMRGSGLGQFCPNEKTAGGGS